MSNVTVVIILAVLVAVVVIMYGIMPRISNSSPNAANWIRLTTFTLIALYLGFDFYTKQKNGYIIVLLLGSAAFYIAIIRNIKKNNR